MPQPFQHTTLREARKSPAAWKASKAFWKTFVVDPEGWRSFLFVVVDGEEQEAKTRRKYMLDAPQLDLIYCFQDFI